MDASHASCAGLYGCSCAELDTLVGVAKGAGALGARLTGERVHLLLGVHAGAVVAIVGCPGRLLPIHHCYSKAYQWFSTEHLHACWRML
jgi:galactokinase